MLVAAAVIVLLGFACQHQEVSDLEEPVQMVVNAPVGLTEPRFYRTFKIELAPVPANAPSHISARAAVDSAREEGASEVTPILAIYTGGGRSVPEGIPRHKNLLAWILRYEGVCVPVIGVSLTETANHRKCAGSELNVVVNAVTGNVLESFSYR